MKIKILKKNKQVSIHTIVIILLLLFISVSILYKKPSVTGRLIYNMLTTEVSEEYEKFCTDSDGSKDYFKMGVVTYLDHNLKVYTKEGKGKTVSAAIIQERDSCWVQKMIIPPPELKKEPYTIEIGVDDDYVLQPIDVKSGLNEYYCDDETKVAKFERINCEYGCKAGACLPKPKLEGDIDDDGCVDVFDLSIIAIAFQNKDLKGDVNKDGKTDQEDLLIVATNFGKGDCKQV